MNIIKFQTKITNHEKILIDDCIKTSSFSLCGFLSDKFLIDITDDSDIVSSFERDWSNMPGNADFLARPINEKQCAIILYICNLLNINVTISAGRTNLTGSATPKGGLVLSIINIKKPNTQVDIENKTAKTSVGTILEDMRNDILQLSNKKLYYPVDPTSRKDALVGGTISCNASGFIPGDKGATRHWVNRLKILLTNGYITNITRGDYITNDAKFILICDDKKIIVEAPSYHRPKIKNASGPFTAAEEELDFIDLIIGSEGVFALIIDVEFNLADSPKDFLDLFITLPSENDAIKLRGYLKQQNILYQLNALEYFGYNCQNYMEHKEKLFKTESSVGIYLQYPIFNNSIDEVIEKWVQLLDDSDCGIKDDNVFLLNTADNWRIFFEARHSMPVKALEKTKELDAISIITDTIVPYKNFNDFIQFSHRILRENNIEYLLFGHLGDCHLHFHVIYNKEEALIINDLYRQIIRKSAELDGVYSAEHGTGKRKTIDFYECYGQEAINQVQKCKLAFDPKNILNTGNIITIKDI